MNISGKRFLITGGTGSFGSTVCEYLLKNDVKEVRIFSRDENKQFQMRRKIKNGKVTFFIGDIRDYDSILEACFDMDFVFHAAALKQVPSCEFYPLEAIKTNKVSLVPNHLKNNASNYLNPHNYKGNSLKQEYLPTDLKGIKFWKPKDSGWEKNKSRDLQ